MLRATIIAIGILLLTVNQAVAILPPCGPSDGDRASMEFRVSPVKRNAFVARLQTIDPTKFDVSHFVGTVPGAEALFIFVKDDPGISIIVTDADHRNVFSLTIGTCNATKDWKPYWEQFRAFMGAINPSDFRS